MRTRKPVIYPRTWYQVALDRGAQESEPGVMSGAELQRVGVAILNGCPDCGATVAPYNSFQLSADNPYAYCGNCAGVEE